MDHRPQAFTDMQKMIRTTLEEHRQLIEASRRAILETRQLLYEIDRRHPEIDFHAVTRN